MAPRITITPQELEACSSFLEGKTAELLEHIGQVKGQIDTVCNNWEGASQQAFIQRFNEELYPILSKTLPEVLEGISKQLSSSAKVMRETDEELARGLGG